MYTVYSNAAVREAEKKVIAGGVGAERLMERAGSLLADAVQSALVRLNLNEALVVCGSGNNGGDGLVCARLLSERGVEVTVLQPDYDKLSPECARAKARYRGEILGLPPRRKYPLIVDCVFGTGLARNPEGIFAALITFINLSGAYVIACDLPSGLAENGVALTPCVRADETVTFALMKSALVLCDGADTAGKVTVKDLGITPVGAGTQIWEESDVRVFFPAKLKNVHKGTFGTAAILAGKELAGAAFLAANACLRSGAGYTKLYVSKEYFEAAIGVSPCAVLKKFEAVDGELLASDCIVLGMGSGVSERLYAMIVELLSGYTGTLVLDADAINTLSEYGTEVLKNKSCEVVLTPHPKEFSRFVSKSVKDVLLHAEELAVAAAKEFDVTVVLKNNRTIITDGTRVAINTTGSPALAKGGSGDVLAGLLGGTLARDVNPFEAACVASYLLGRAGERTAEEIGEYAACASDVIDRLPQVIREVEGTCRKSR